MTPPGPFPICAARMDPRQLCAILDQLETCIYTKDLAGRYTYVNREVCKLFGCTSEQITGKTDEDFFDLEMADSLRRNDREVMATGRGVAREELDLLKASGEARYYWTVKQPLVDENGRIVGIYGISTDITERKQRELELLEARDELHATLDALPDPMFKVDLDGRILDYRSANLDLHRDRSGSLRGRTLQELLPAEATQTCIAALREANAAGHASGACFEMQTVAGKRCFELSVSRKASPTGHTPWLVVLFRDITGRRDAEEALREREALLSAVMNVIPDPVLVKDQRGAFLLCNEAVARLYDTTAERMVGKHDGDFGVPQEMAERFRENVLGIMARGEPEVVLEDSRDAASGEIRHYQSIKKPFKSSLGEDRVLVIAHDITELVRTKQRVEASERRLQEVLEATREGIWDWEIKSGRVTHNTQWYRLLGFEVSKDSDTVEAFASRLHPDDREAVWLRLQALLDGQAEAYYSEHRLIRADGSVMWVQDRGRIVERDAAGCAMRMVGSASDISSRKQVEMELAMYRNHLEELVASRTCELAAAKTAAEAANVAKSAFLANMSHEIRTPLNAITGTAHLMRRAGVSAEQARQLQRMVTAGDHLLQIISNVLDLSKIEAGRFELYRDTIALQDLVAGAAALLQAQCDSKQLQLKVEVATLPPLLSGDQTRLRQALLNYLSNAVRFTERGSISLRCAIAEETDHDALIRFEVQDTGMGIGPEVMPRLFAAFEQADNSSRRAHGGTGLGLAITRRLARLMNGDAGATSTPGVGSTFWFTARLDKIASVKSTPVAKSANAGEAIAREHAGRRVLVVEDEPFNREITLCLLEDAALQVELAGNGEEALQMCAGQRYDLILMDMQMPVMDGVEATRRIRAEAAWRAVPIVAMTANAFAEDRRRCIEAGMDDFITKPMLPETFYGLLLRWLGRSHA